MKDQLNDQQTLFEHRIFQQMQDLPTILQQQEAVDPNDVKDFIEDIAELLQKTGKELNQQQDINRSLQAD